LSSFRQEKTKSPSMLLKLSKILPIRCKTIGRCCHFAETNLSLFIHIQPQIDSGS